MGRSDKCNHVIVDILNLRGYVTHNQRQEVFNLIIPGVSEVPVPLKWRSDRYNQMNVVIP